FMVALLRARGVDVVFRMHASRDVDFRRGRRLGRGDHVVQWQRPPRPGWMDEDTYADMPRALAIREVRRQVATPGFRAEELVVATTLLDAERPVPAGPGPARHPPGRLPVRRLGHHPP